MKAVCAIIRNEHRFIREFAEHHLRIGFDRVYLFEDTGSESHAGLINDSRVVLRRFEDCGIPAETGFRQMDLYIWFLKAYRKTVSWCAFIDADEFIVLNDGITLAGLTDRFKQYPAIALYWKVYNANGHIARPDLPVMEAYTQTVKWYRHWDFKSFANLKKAGKWLNNHCIEDVVDVNATPVAGMYEKPVYGAAHINHYYTKSWEDFVDQLKVGTFSYNNRNCDDFFIMNPELWPKAWDMVMSIAGDRFPSTDCLSKVMGIYTDRKRTDLAQINRRPLIHSYRCKPY
jgi:hypothetical protein